MIRKGAHKKKGRVMKVTRPEPTIYGNCDGWSFIVGKTGRAYSRQAMRTRPLQACNWNVVHRFSTNREWVREDNMWARCGSAVDACRTSRIVVQRGPDMTGSALLAPILLNPVLRDSRKLASAN
ncbi:hypothetical protein [Ramlibacter alkalitolerans]|uniref:Uncharacterized protein n=1 Tax=Ramlibacter alkalitolerans TaxID=2039631 RepID=A0ABS1JR92_9BURK|nr:hypothetical protein [Ramlibacter alkalitolerans]